MRGCHIPKQHFIALAGNSKLHIIVLKGVITIKLSIGKNIAGLEMMTPMNQMFPNL